MLVYKYDEAREVTRLVNTPSREELYESIESEEGKEFFLEALRKLDKYGMEYGREVIVELANLKYRKETDGIHKS